MSREAARVEIVAAIAAAGAAFAGGYVPEVDYENKDLINYAALTNPYVAVDLVYNNGDQLDLGTAPIKRVTGFIGISVCVPEGRGTKDANVLMDHFEKSLQYRVFSLVKTEVSKPQGSVRRKGWFCLVSFVPFWYDEPVT